MLCIGEEACRVQSSRTHDTAEVSTDAPLWRGLRRRIFSYKFYSSWFIVKLLHVHGVLHAVRSAAFIGVTLQWRRFGRFPWLIFFLLRTYRLVLMTCTYVFPKYGIQHAFPKL